MRSLGGPVKKNQHVKKKEKKITSNLEAMLEDEKDGMRRTEAPQQKKERWK